ncbi:MAG: LLM class flavin-dependent oxidoreductase [Chloroflexi bacterium]|nr:LLM class flavin-dependent oxidoreductase [Chloroflexota bacterium]
MQFHSPDDPSGSSRNALDLILTYHVEGERETPSAEVYAEIERQVRLADELGYHAAWFAEHHFHVHRGHLPNPLLFALHLAGKTSRIQLGSAVLTVALHHHLRLAEDLLTADVLTGGRLSIGLGSGSTPPEFAAFGVPKAEQEAAPRQARFAEYLDVLERAWRGEPISIDGRYVQVDVPSLLPCATRPLSDSLWIAANSAGQATVAGRRGYGLMLSRERSLDEMLTLVQAYETGRAESGLPARGGRVAASRALLVAPTDEAARCAAEEAVSILVKRQRETRPQYANLPLPVSFDVACRRVQFLAGGPDMIAEDIRRLRQEVPFAAFHIQSRWQGLAPRDVEQSIELFARDVVPRLRG